MKYTSKELRAIQYFANNRNARLSLCSYTKIFFVDKATNTEFTEELDKIVKLYDIGRKEDAKERRRINRETVAATAAGKDGVDL